jgi:hypothetical protein
MRRRRLNVCLAAAALTLLAAGGGQASPPQEPKTRPSAGVAPAAPKAERDRRLPFSSLDLALLTAGGAPLLLIGASLRRRRSAPKVQPARRRTDPGLAS